jgi:hypothetical protein
MRKKKEEEERKRLQSSKEISVVTVFIEYTVKKIYGFESLPFS